MHWCTNLVFLKERSAHIAVERVGEMGLQNLQSEENTCLKMFDVDELVLSLTYPRGRLISQHCRWS